MRTARQIMWQRRLFVGFLCRFTVLFALLVAPWPGSNEGVSSCLRAFGKNVFTRESGARDVTFEAQSGKGPELQGTDTRIVIANRALMHRDGSGSVRNVDIGLGALGRKSSALLIALIIASPVSWRRRGISLVAGVAILHLCILALLWFDIWIESAEVGLIELSSDTETFLTGLLQLSVAHFSLTVPFLIWILATFKTEDMVRLFKKSALHVLIPSALTPRQREVSAKVNV